MVCGTVLQVAFALACMEFEDFGELKNIDGPDLCYRPTHHIYRFTRIMREYGHEYKVRSENHNERSRKVVITIMANACTSDDWQKCRT